MKRQKLFLLFNTFVFLLIVVGGIAICWELKMHGLSVRRKPMSVEIWMARRARDLATPRTVKDLKNPIKTTELVIAEARDHFADHCAMCHGNNGDGKTMLGEGMFPPPPDLRKNTTQDLTNGEIFNIIKEGIPFTGMPGFGGNDEDSWKLVAFIRHLPKLSKTELEFMKEINQIDSVEIKQ